MSDVELKEPTKSELGVIDSLIDEKEESAENIDEIYGGQGVWEKKERWKLDKYGIPIAPKKIKDYGKRLIKEVKQS